MNKRSERWLTLANCLTATRILLIPAIMQAISHRDWEQSTFLFACAALTDLFDGWAARWCSEPTVLGSYLDPIADKLLLLGTLSALSTVPTAVCAIPGWFVTLVFAKEAVLVGGIVLLLGLGNKLEINPTNLSKFATCAQFSLLLCALLGIPVDFLLGASTILTCGALAQYAYVGARIFVKSMLRGQL